MGSILKFLAAFLTILRKCTPQCAELLTLLPPSIMKQKSYTGIQHLSKLKKVLHMPSNIRVLKCFQGAGASLRSKLCTCREFPNLRMRMPCRTPLLISVEVSVGHKVLYPFLTYCFMGIKSSFFLSDLFQCLKSFRGGSKQSLVCL